MQAQAGHASIESTRIFLHLADDNKAAAAAGLPHVHPHQLRHTGPWLHVPVGKLREDRYLPLHPQLVALIDEYRSRHVAIITLR